MDILKKLVIITILFMPLGEVGRYLFPSIGSVPFVLNDALVGMTIVVWIVLKIQRKEKIQARLCVPIMLFICLTLFSLLVNSAFLPFPQIGIAALYILRWSVYAGLYFVVSEFDTTFQQKIIYLLLGVGQTIVVLGYVQYFFYPSLRNLYYLGWDEHLYRMFSLFFDPNFAGVFFVLVLLLTVGQSLVLFKKKKNTLAILLVLFVLLDVIAVYLTYSRSALLMLLSASVIFLALYGKKNYIIGAIAFLILAIFLSPKSFQTEGTNLFRVASSEARLNSAATALKIIQQHPFFGVGFNAYRYAQKEEGGVSAKDWMDTHAGGGTDNSFLFVLATTGITGFGVYMYLWFRVFYLEVLSFSERYQKRILAISTISSLFGVFVSAFFINSLFYIFIMEWLWIIIAISTSVTRENT